MIDYNAQRLANFNPRSHEGSDSGYYHQGDRSCISIHAPTRGATNDSGHFSFKNGISIHAPTRGATLKDISIFINTLDFNPRSHEGSDAAESAGAATLQLFQSTLPRGERRGGICRCCYFAAISIHAPTRGATQINKAGDTYQAFQSTLPRGERRFRSV